MMYALEKMDKQVDEKKAATYFENQFLCYKQAAYLIKQKSGFTDPQKYLLKFPKLLGYLVQLSNNKFCDFNFKMIKEDLIEKGKWIGVSKDQSKAYGNCSLLIQGMADKSQEFINCAYKVGGDLTQPEQIKNEFVKKFKMFQGKEYNCSILDPKLVEIDDAGQVVTKQKYLLTGPKQLKIENK